MRRLPPSRSTVQRTRPVVGMALAIPTNASTLNLSVMIGGNS
jgi:hypothetical protein